MRRGISMAVTAPPADGDAYEASAAGDARPHTWISRSVLARLRSIHTPRRPCAPIACVLRKPRAPPSSPLCMRRESRAGMCTESGVGEGEGVKFAE